MSLLNNEEKEIVKVVLNDWKVKYSESDIRNWDHDYITFSKRKGSYTEHVKYSTILDYYKNNMGCKKYSHFEYIQKQVNSHQLHDSMLKFILQSTKPQRYKVLYEEDGDFISYSCRIKRSEAIKLNRVCDAFGVSPSKLLRDYVKEIANNSDYIINHYRKGE